MYTASKDFALLNRGRSSLKSLHHFCYSFSTINAVCLEPTKKLSLWDLYSLDNLAWKFFFADLGEISISGKGLPEYC